MLSFKQIYVFGELCWLSSQQHSRELLNCFVRPDLFQPEQMNTILIHMEAQTYSPPPFHFRWLGFKAGKLSSKIKSRKQPNLLLMLD